jgi:hypothetical protein
VTGAIDDLGIRAEPPAPERFVDDDDALRSRCGFVGADESANDGAYAEQRKE